MQEVRSDLHCFSALLSFRSSRDRRAFFFLAKGVGGLSHVMTTIRRFACNDLFTFNAVNLDYFTETVRPDQEECGGRKQLQER